MAHAQRELADAHEAEAHRLAREARVARTRGRLVDAFPKDERGPVSRDEYYRRAAKSGAQAEEHAARAAEMQDIAQQSEKAARGGGFVAGLQNIALKPQGRG